MNSKSTADAQDEHRVDKGSSSSPAPPAVADQTERFEFLGLPLELRIQIYGIAFSDHNHTGHTDAKPAGREELRDCARARVQAPGVLPVAMASKQIYREALPILYKTYNFRLSMWDEDVPRQKANDLTGRLSAQLRRPLALLMLPRISHLDLSVSLAVVNNCIDQVSSILHLINLVCLGLQTFCLHMDLLPQRWDCCAERRNDVLFESERLRGLRGLANRVRVFKIDILLLDSVKHYGPFLEYLIPGSAWLDRDHDRMSWVCQGTEGQKSMVFRKKQGVP